MKQSVLTIALCRVCVVLPFLALIPGETCAGQEPTEGGNAPVTRQIQGKEPFQPVLKGPTLDELNLKTAEYLFVRSRILEAEKKERQALQCCERACQYVSSDAILVCLVQLALQQKRYDEALCYFDKIQYPAALGISALDELATLCRRLNENSRVVKTYRAILSAIPMTESGPLRMLVHERLGLAEYSAGNYDEALLSLNAIHTMLKDPARYGINAEDARLFEDGREVNLLILLDVHLLKKNISEAKAIFAELKAFKEKEFAETSLPKEMLDKQKEAWNLQILFNSARLALLDSNPKDAERLVMEAYEKGYTEEETPYQLLEQILEVQDRKNDLTMVLENLCQKTPENPILKARLAEQYIQNAVDAENEAEKLLFTQKGQNLLKELQKEVPVWAVQVQLMRLAVMQKDFQLFLKTGESMEKIFLANDSVKEVLQSIQTFMEPKSESEAESQTTEEKPAKGESKEIFPEGSPFRQFAQDLIHFVDKKLAEKPDLKFGWPRAWFLGTLCRELDPKSEQALNYYDSACETLRQKPFSTEQKPAVVAFFNDWGTFFEKNDLNERAETNCRLALEVVPDWEAFGLDLIRALAVNGKLEDALEKVRVERQKDPDFLEATLLEALLLQQYGKIDEACLVLHQVLDELDENYSAELNRKAVLGIKLQLSNQEDVRGNKAEAEELLRQCIDEFPDDLSAKNSIAYFWACENRNLKQAREYSEATLKESPDEAMYQDTLAWICFRLGDFGKAQELLLKASGTLGDPVVFSHLGDVALALNQKEKAIQYFNQSEKLFQESRRKHQFVNTVDEEHVKAQLKTLQN